MNLNVENNEKILMLKKCYALANYYENITDEIYQKIILLIG